ncbi:MAG: peptide/nickel transport system permease protein [Actinomycetota bacterium]|nr:peptide/nickel transport system permease protein [Actinomycetota bacterium]
MSEYSEIDPTGLVEAPRGRATRPTKATLRERRKRRIWPTLIPVGVFVFFAIFGPLIVPFNAVSTNIVDRLRAPGSVLSNGSTAWLGTDQVGRDMLGEVIAGARLTLIMAIATIIIAGIIGIVLGLVAGYFGGWIDNVIMRLADLQLAFPGLLLAILIAGVLGPSVRNVVISLAVTRWVTFARLARSSALSVRKLDYVSAARLLGASHVRLLSRYLLPASISPLFVLGTVEVGSVVLSAASLSFLGLGVPPDQVDWGSTIAAGSDYLLSAWWISTMPGIALAGLVLSVSVLGDKLQARFAAARSR